MRGRSLVCLLTIVPSVVWAPKAAAKATLPIPVEMGRFNPKDLPGPHPATRERVCLNGEWGFCPILDGGREHGPALETPPPLPREGEWRKFPVPAKWRRLGTLGSSDYGTPAEWAEAGRAWYRRTLDLPAGMRRKRIKLHFGGVLVYTEDGTTHEVPVRNGVEVADWTAATRRRLKRAAVAWTGSNPKHPTVGLYRLSVENPAPGKRIAALDFISDGRAIPILVAVTLQR